MWLIYGISIGLSLFVALPVLYWRATRAASSRPERLSSYYTSKWNLFVPLILLAGIVGLWAGLGWHHQWWWTPIILGVTIWWLREQYISLRRAREPRE
jgi:hypothetical protein